ncbi:hypothetical protein [Pseudomonas putida]|nr:hypothetical protein [Pseudomonas putida]
MKKLTANTEIQKAKKQPEGCFFSRKVATGATGQTALRPVFP